MSSRLEQATSKEKIEPLRIKDKKLLQDVSDGGKDKGVEEQYELERRYLPARFLSQEKLSQYQTLDIEQAYISALNKKGEERTFRLRRTWNKKDGIMLRVARKRKVAGYPRARNESQKAFSEDAPEAKEFKQLWAQKKWEPLRKRRYYIPLKLPNGGKAEIHYDVHPFYPLEGLVRIEIEFESAEDEMYVLEHPKVLPNWIGEDVTENGHYGGKALAKDGMPPSAGKLMRELRGKTKSGAR